MDNHEDAGRAWAARIIRMVESAKDQ